MKFFGILKPFFQKGFKVRRGHFLSSVFAVSGVAVT